MDDGTLAARDTPATSLDDNIFDLDSRRLAVASTDALRASSDLGEEDRAVVPTQHCPKKGDIGSFHSCNTLCTVRMDHLRMSAGASLA
ncbi:hypothetical protein E4U52_004787 [Claviceps spartinae]|nr:hypothetical protein E4U52_004787 [Claviceps spartinae]